MTTLDEIRKRWAAATPGPWWHEAHEGRSRAAKYGWHYVAGGQRFLAKGLDEPDAHAIAHSPTDIAWLLAEVDRLKGEVENG